MTAMGNEAIQIMSRDFWFKIVDVLQQNWALVEPSLETGQAKIYFINDASEVFDTMVFESKDGAEQGLTRNGFTRFADDLVFQELVWPPKEPFIVATHLKGPIYSSGRCWR